MLRYAGGKTRAVKQLNAYIPDGTTEIVSPFLGGGSFELSLAKRGVKVSASDSLAPLVAFWTTLKLDREELIRQLKERHPFTKELYLECRGKLHEDTTPLETAVRFFIVNRCCFSGCMKGGYTSSRSPLSILEKLRDVDLTHLQVQCYDYETQMNAHPNTFAFLDPPYDVPNLYLSDAFDHERLAAVLRRRKSSWILCYNDTPRIRALYESWCDIRPVQWSYGMNDSKQSNEIIILPCVQTVPYNEM